MPGLFDLLDSEDGRLGLALLAAAGPSMQPTSIGQRIAGAVQSVGSQRDNDLRRKLINSQIEENANQNTYRSAQVNKLAQIQGLTSGLLGDWGSPSTAAPAAGAGVGGAATARAGARGGAASRRGPLSRRNLAIRSTAFRARSRLPPAVRTRP